MPPVHLQMILILILILCSTSNLTKALAKQGGGAQDQKIPGFAKNNLGIALQNFVFL